MKLQSLIAPIALCLAANLVAATVPGAPTITSSVPWAQTILVYFTPPANDGGAPITSYEVTSTTANWMTGTGPTSPVMVCGVDANMNTYRVRATNSAGTGPWSAASQALSPPNGSNAETPNVYNVYSNGEFYWAGFFFAGITANFADTTGHPRGGQFDIMCSAGGGGNGAIGIYGSGSAPRNFVDLSGYRYMEMDLKPMMAGKSWTLQWELENDVPVYPTATLPGKYGPASVSGQWAHYCIPLADIGVGPGTPNPIVYKFILTDQTGTANVYYIENVRFTVNSTSVEEHKTAAVASVDHSLNVSVEDRTLSFAAKSTGKLAIYDLVGNRLAALQAGTRANVSWAAPSSGAYLARFEGAGVIETQRVFIK